MLKTELKYKNEITVLKYPAWVTETSQRKSQKQVLVELGIFAIFAVELEHKIFFIILYLPLLSYMSYFCLKNECLDICWSLSLILKAASILNRFQCLRKLSRHAGALEIISSTV